MLYKLDLVQVHHGLDYLRQMRDSIDYSPDKSATAMLPLEIQLVLNQALNFAEGGLEGLNFSRIPSLIDSIRTLLSTGKPMLLHPVYDAVTSLENIVKHEIQCTRFYQLPRDEIKYLLPDSISDEIRNGFSDCIFDLEEANKCFAFGLNTSCVYHCMCVLDKVLPVIAKRVNTLGIQYTLQPGSLDSWGTILNKLESELNTLSKLPRATRVQKTIEEQSSLITYMRAVKFAWRDKTMHARSQYSPEIARSVLEQTIGLLNYLDAH